MNSENATPAIVQNPLAEVTDTLISLPGGRVAGRPVDSNPSAKRRIEHSPANVRISLGIDRCTDACQPMHRRMVADPTGVVADERSHGAVLF
jgi:hypothetical protein